MLEMCFVFTLWSVKESGRDTERGVRAEGEALGSRQDAPEAPLKRKRAAGRVPLTSQAVGRAGSICIFKS